MQMPGAFGVPSIHCNSSSPQSVLIWAQSLVPRLRAFDVQHGLRLLHQVTRAE